MTLDEKRTRLKLAIEDLPTDVARLLHKQGYRGHPRHDVRDPLARYLAAKCGFLVSVGPKVAMFPPWSAKDNEVPLVSQASKFVADFDAGKHPELVEPG